MQLSTLVVAEHKAGALAGSTLNTITAGAQLGGDLTALIAGQDIGAVAEQASKVKGVSKVRSTHYLCVLLLSTLSASAQAHVVAGASKTHAGSPCAAHRCWWQMTHACNTNSLSRFRMSLRQCSNGEQLPATAGNGSM